jgi:hypothetical protein
MCKYWARSWELVLLADSQLLSVQLLPGESLIRINIQPYFLLAGLTPFVLHLFLIHCVRILY